MVTITTLETNNIISKRIFARIDNTLTNLITAAFGASSVNEVPLTIFRNCIFKLLNQEKDTQSIIDFGVNIEYSDQPGVMILGVRYQQMNCLIVTSVRYKIVTGD